MATTKTRQDFQLIADVLAHRGMAIRMLAKDTVKGREAETARLAENNLTIIEFASELAHTNPNFDKDRFLTAAKGK